MTDPNTPSTDPEGSPRVVPAPVNESSVHRHATLKKRDSVKPAPFKRSNAGTPMPPSPASPRLDGQRNDVTKNPLYCPVPTNADPTVVLAMRFQGTTIPNSKPLTPKQLSLRTETDRVMRSLAKRSQRIHQLL